MIQKKNSHERLILGSTALMDDPAIVGLQIQLGRMCYEQSKWRMSADHYLLVLKALSKSFGFDSIELIMPCRHLSDCYRELGQFSLAEHFLERALKISIVDTEEWGQIQEQFATLYRRQEQWEKSLAYSDDALEAARRNLGTN